MADQAYQSARAAYIEGRMENVLERKKQLYALQELLAKELPQIEEALEDDLDRNQGDAGAEVDVVIRTIQKLYNNLDFQKTLSDEKDLARGESHVQFRKPSGIILIVSEYWNPFALSLVPLATAIAHGCPAVLCLPARTPSCNQIISDILQRSIDMEAYRTIHTKSPSTVTELSRLPFDIAEIQLLEPQPQIQASLREANPRCQINEIHRGVVTAVVFRTAHLRTSASELGQAVSSFNGTSPNIPRLVFVDEFVLEEFKDLLITNLDPLQKTTNTHALARKSQHEQLIRQRPKAQVYPTNAIASIGSTDLLVLDRNDSVSPKDLEDLSSKARANEMLVLVPLTSLDLAIDRINAMNQRELPQVTYAFADSRSAAYLAKFIHGLAFSINHIFVEDLVTLRSSLGTHASVTQSVNCSLTTDSTASIASKTSILSYGTENSRIEKIKQAAGYRLSYFEQGALLGLGIFGLLGTIVVTGAVRLYSKFRL